MAKKILLLGELYKPLIPWFLHDEPPKGVPAVYNLYQFLGNHPDYQFHSIIYNPEVNRIKTFPNGSVIELKKFSFPIYYVWKLLVFIKLFFWSNRELQKKSYNLVYGLSTFATIAALTGKLNQVPSAGRIYGTILTKHVQDRNYFKLYTRFFFDVLAIKIPADKVIATLDGTEYDKVFHFFNPTKEKQPTLLYNGMDKNLRTKLLSFPIVTNWSSPTRFCYIARLESYKRQELAIEIVDKLVHKYKWTDLKFTILGSGSRSDFLKDLVKEKKLTNYIQFISEMPHQEIPNFLSTQDAAFFFYEGGSLGNILWESALAGRLIITVDNAGTGVLFKEEINSIIAPESDDFVEVMAKKLAEMREADLAPLSQASRELVAGLVHTWEERFEREFEILLKG